MKMQTKKRPARRWKIEVSMGSPFLLYQKRKRFRYWQRRERELQVKGYYCLIILLTKEE